jgi:hypothetical protein
MITRRRPVENSPLSPRAPLSPVGRLTAYGKLAFGHLPTWLGKPAAGFPQLHSLDDDGVYFFSDSGLTLYRGTSGERGPIPDVVPG